VYEGVVDIARHSTWIKPQWRNKMRMREKERERERGGGRRERNDISQITSP